MDKINLDVLGYLVEFLGLEDINNIRLTNRRFKQASLRRFLKLKTIRIKAMALFKNVQQNHGTRRGIRRTRLWMACYAYAKNVYAKNVYAKNA